MDNNQHVPNCQVAAVSGSQFGEKEKGKMTRLKMEIPSF
jgi:hypothetical protein